MVEKLPVIIGNRGDNTVASVLHRLLPNLYKNRVATGVFEAGVFSTAPNGVIIGRK
jgi:hypothetical protein